MKFVSKTKMMLFKENDFDHEDVEREAENIREKKRRLNERLRLWKIKRREIMRNFQRRLGAAMKLQHKLMVTMEEMKQYFLVFFPWLLGASLADLAQFQELQDTLNNLMRDNNRNICKIEKTLEEITLQSDDNLGINII